MARGLSHTGARYECAALRPHVATVDDLFLCGADIGAGAGECASELLGGWLCAHAVSADRRRLARVARPRARH